MSKRNFHSKPGFEVGKRSGRAWKEVWRALSTLTLVTLLPVASVAQGQGPFQNPQGSTQGPVYGGGIQTPLLFEGETAPANQVSLSLGAAPFYDDNVFSLNSERLQDEGVVFDAHLGVIKRSDRLTATFDYTPSFLLYRQFDQLDRANHLGSLNLDYQLTSTFIVGLHDSLSYQNGEEYAFPTQLPISAGLPPPSVPNQNLFAYTTRVLSNGSGLDLTYVKNRHTSVTFSGSYSLLTFGSEVASLPLYDTKGFGVSVAVNHYLSAHTTLGILLLHQDSTYTGGQVFGNRQRSQIESSFLSFGSRITPAVTINLFGGPQYIDTVGQTSATGRVAGHFQGSGGGSITKEVRKTALNLMIQRSVTGSGGLYTSEINTTAAFSARRRLLGSWEGDCRVGAAQADASLFKLANGRTDGLFGGVTISRPLAHGALFHVSYDTVHQLSKGTLPIFVDFDRNRIETGIEYQIKALSLGR